MKKAEYEKYIIPSEFEKLYIEWANKGKPTGRDPLYFKVWDGVTNAVKACVGALQARYCCKYQDYDEKVMDGTIDVMRRLMKLEEPPRNIINVAYLPTLGVCCGPKARQKEFEDNAMSVDVQTDSGDSYIDILDEDTLINY